MRKGRTSPADPSQRVRKRPHDDPRGRGREHGGGAHPAASAQAIKSAEKSRNPRHQSTQKQMSFLQGKHQQRVGNVVSRLGPAAVGQTTLMDKKRKLYSDTSQQPLWSLRKITINPTDKDDLRRFPSNAIYTHRYSVMTFAVKNLWEQFHRVINWWFLVMTIIQAVPQLHYNPNHAWSTALPFAIVLVFGMLKDAFTDLGRRQRDRVLNQRVCCIVDGHTPQLRLLQWQGVRVGNILRLTDGEEVPADIVVLATSNSDGVAYVETSKLDGETNLKFKQGVKETRGESSPLSIAGIRGRVVCEKPCAVMDAFTGSLKLDAHPRATPLDIVHFIQRGSHIRNTEWLYGVVIYTGEDTRIQKNAAPPGFKRPHIEKDINTYLFISFFIVFLTILISVMSKWSVQERDSGDAGVAESGSSGSSGSSSVEPAQTYGSSVEFMLGSRDLLQNPWMSILRFLAVYAPVLPLSLPLILDVVYLLQSVLIEGDIHIRGGGRLPSTGPSTGSTSSLTVAEDALHDGEGGPLEYSHASQHAAPSQQPLAFVSKGLYKTRRFLSEKFSSRASGRWGAHSVERRDTPREEDDERETNGENVPSGTPAVPGSGDRGDEETGENAEGAGEPDHKADDRLDVKRLDTAAHAASPPATSASEATNLQDDDQDGVPPEEKASVFGGRRSDERDRKSSCSRYSEGGAEKAIHATSVGRFPGSVLPNPYSKLHGDTTNAGFESSWQNYSSGHPNTRSLLLAPGGGPGSWCPTGNFDGEDVWAEVHTPALNPNLGQVDFIFTDKTGTITENDMTFSMCSVAGKIYGMASCGGGLDGAESTDYGSRVWALTAASSRGSRDRLMLQPQRTGSVSSARSQAISVSALAEGTPRRVPTLRLRSHTYRGRLQSRLSRTSQDDEEKAKDSSPGAGGSPLSRGSSSRVSGSTSFEAHEGIGGDQEDEAGPGDRDTPSAPAEGPASGAPPLMVREGIHGASLWRRPNGSAGRLSTSRQSSRQQSEDERQHTEGDGGETEDDRSTMSRRGREQRYSREFRGGSRSSTSQDGELSDRQPLRCIRSIGDGYIVRDVRGPGNAASMQQSGVAFSRPVSQFTFTSRVAGDESPDDQRRLIFSGRGSPRSVSPPSERGVASPSIGEEGPPLSPQVSPTGSGPRARRGPRGSLFMPAVEEEDEHDSYSRARSRDLHAGIPPHLSPSPSRAGVPFLYDDIEFPTGFRETPMEGQIRRNCDFYDASIFTDLARRDLRSHRINEFIKCMALCNTVVPWVYTAMPCSSGGPGMSSTANFSAAAYPTGGPGNSLFSCSASVFTAPATAVTGFTSGAQHAADVSEVAAADDEEEKNLSELLLPTGLGGAPGPGGAKGDPQLLPLLGRQGQTGGGFAASGAGVSSPGGGAGGAGGPGARGHVGLHASRRTRAGSECSRGATSRAVPLLGTDAAGAGGGPDYLPSPRPTSSSGPTNSSTASLGEAAKQKPAESPEVPSASASPPAKEGEEAPSSTPRCVFAPSAVVPQSVLRSHTGAGGLRPSKSLARGVSFKEKHEEFAFSKDDDTATLDQDDTHSGAEEDPDVDDGAGADDEQGKGDDEECVKASERLMKAKKNRSASASLMSLKSKVTASGRDVADLLFRRASRGHTGTDTEPMPSLSARTMGRAPSLDRGHHPPTHAGISTVTAGGDGRGNLINIIKYQASSPDEECLVSAASHMGYTLVSRTNNYATLNINGQERRWQIIGVNEFTQKRGRMSIVVRPQDWTEGSILYVKGADVAMLDLLSTSFTRGHDYRQSCSSLSRVAESAPGRAGPQEPVSRLHSAASCGGRPGPSAMPRSPNGAGSEPGVQPGHSWSLPRSAPPAPGPGTGEEPKAGDGEGAQHEEHAGKHPRRQHSDHPQDEGLRSRLARADSMLKALNPALYNYDRQHQRANTTVRGDGEDEPQQEASEAHGGTCGDTGYETHARESTEATAAAAGGQGPEAAQCAPAAHHRLASQPGVSAAWGAGHPGAGNPEENFCAAFFDDDEDELIALGDIALVEQHLKRFSLQGLRTMALACRYLTQEETETYKRLYTDACASVYCRAERLEEVAEDMERDLEYLGITGVRDKLQEQVPETLQLMMEAGIRVWMVTGDNVEYALHICHSCRLLTSRTRIFHAALEFSGRKAKREGVMLYELFRKARRLKRSDEHICLVVTGPNLRTFLNHPDLQTYFLNMACCSDVVVAARVTPSQKAEMVRLVKKRLTPQPITLAVGDGGNDVAMLQEAHVGVAIRGQDSAAAVAAAYADYSFTEFRFLQRLLFVHGRLSLMRVSTVILWSFFKSLCIGLPSFLFQPQAFWSAVEVYDPLLLMIVDFIWTTIPGIIHGYSDQDLPTHLLPCVPVLYTPGRRRLYFNGFRFILWTVEGIVYSFLIFYLLQATWMDGSTIHDGQVLGFHSYGILLLFGSLLESNVRIILETSLWTPTFLFTTIVLCTVMFFPTVLLYSLTGWPRRYMELAGRVAFAWPMLYFLIPLWISIGILVQLLLQVFTSSLFPNISGSVKQYLALKQADVNFRRKASKLPFTHPRPRLLPGGHDEYGWFCGMGSCLSLFKRALWFMGGCCWMDTPNLADEFVASPELCVELRERFNPLRHKSVADRLPPPRRFRINENFLPYTGATDEKGDGAQRDLGGKGGTGGAGLAAGSGGAGAGRSKSVFGGAAAGVMPMADMAADLETENSLSSNGSEQEKAGDNHTKLVKVSHLINRFTLRFKDMQLEADYQIHNKKSFLKRLVPWYRVIFMLIALYELLSFLTEYFIDIHWNADQTEMQPWMCLPTLVVEVGFAAVVVCTFYDFIFLDHFSLILNSIVFLMVSSNIIFYAVSHVDGTLTSVLFPVFTFVILRISFLQAVAWNIIFLAVTVARFTLDKKYLPPLNFVHYIPLFIGIDVFVAFVGYRLEYNQRKSFLLDYSVDASRRKQREILNTMLPSFVVDQMINSELNEEGIPTSLKAEDRGTVSVIFCDVYEFQHVVASIEPTRLVEVLDSLFLCFDRSAEQFGCTKIETVFETYLAAAGLQPGREPSSASYQQDACDALDMALAMLEVAAQIRYEVKTSNQAIGSAASGVGPALSGSSLDGSGNHVEPRLSLHAHNAAVAMGSRMNSRRFNRQKTGNVVRTVLQSRPQRIRVKIGIHSGRVISGVVGAKKPQYALFGDTVNTASRMKTTGQPGYIHISEDSYELVKGDDTLEYELRHTEVKGKGLMNTYLLVRVKGSPYPHFDDQEGEEGEGVSESGGPNDESRRSTASQYEPPVSGEPARRESRGLSGVHTADPALSSLASRQAGERAETAAELAAAQAREGEIQAEIDEVANVEDTVDKVAQDFRHVRREASHTATKNLSRAPRDGRADSQFGHRVPRRGPHLLFQSAKEHGAAEPQPGEAPIFRSPEETETISGVERGQRFWASASSPDRGDARAPGRSGDGKLTSDGCFDYESMTTQQLLRIYQRQQKTSKVLRWIDEELRGQRSKVDGEKTAELVAKLLAAAEARPAGEASAQPEGEDGGVPLEEIKDELRRQAAEAEEKERQRLAQPVPHNMTRKELLRAFRSEVVHGQSAPAEETEDTAKPEEPKESGAASPGEGAREANGQCVSKDAAESGAKRQGEGAPHLDGTAASSVPSHGMKAGEDEASGQGERQSAAGRLVHAMAQSVSSLFRRRKATAPTEAASPANAEIPPENRVPASAVDDEDMEQSRLTRISVSSEWLLLKFKDKNLEARYRTHFYNNKSNINTIEQALIIFLVTFCVQTLTRLALPRFYVVCSQHTIDLHVCTGLYWAVRATYTLAAFALWLLFHYRNRKEVATCMELRWMVFLLNLLFISAACVFALSNSWGVCGQHQAEEAMSEADVESALAALSRVSGDQAAQVHDAALPVPSVTTSAHSTTSQFPTAGVSRVTRVMKSSNVKVREGYDHARFPSLTDGDEDHEVEQVDGRAYTYWLLSDTIELFFYIVILHHNTGLLFQNCILVDVLLMTMSLTFIITTARETASTVSSIATFPCYVFFNLVSAYCKEYIDRLTFYVNEHAKTTESRATQLLNDMLPKQVLEEFQQDKLKLAYLHENVTFLFADICGFTSWAKGVDACEVVTMLQKLFAKFDKDSTKFGLYKLCTIGDAYVAVSEPVTAENAQDTDPREGMWLVYEMAKAMIGNITEVRERLCIPNLNMRIGLHYGSCVGGVIGSGRLRYDLWGMDVLTGNMMESNGVPGKINVSEILKNEMEKGFPGEFVFKFNKRVAVLQSTVDSYLIRPAKEFDEDEELVAAAASMAVAGPSASLQQGAPSLPQVQTVTSGLRRDATSLRGNYRRRFTILGSAPRVLGRRQSLKGHQFGSIPLTSHGGSGHGDELRPLGEEERMDGSAAPSHADHTHREGEDDEIDGLRQLRKEIERAGGVTLDVSPSEFASVPGSPPAP
ncbi:putative adenylate and guanylate cyclase catalytic domain-containing protein [Neospora caninum Liverpool]|uniref:guanylate cyclase n=3 Tax=Sarcocystidae TaxID=5809 RepID=F0V9H2_NEOCL|nr:putative adenylate and guanylate cyclase catalytic domain-containing protein [Neospora caninum Liverpool]CBZ50397.1 putative adenylate and guanylate cyclase catalytic domain-containing protein [Neospora caninum Liverpool]CEL65005.1 TPA: adenylate and guanylate cyclase catalytic domain-containing protein, putative [Neospora caninum Liverpool]|eukprot:XP_003880431.1 putative adenylate and guanylate cyclase catalytic domain-containing protein [Neospora caninum Liverpool]